MRFQRLSELVAEERDEIETLLRPDPVLSFYWDTAMEDLARGIDNRLARLCTGGGGVIIGATFGDLTVFSPHGTVEDADIIACAAWAGPVEIHAPLVETTRYQDLSKARLIQAREMLVFGRNGPVAEPTAGYRILTSADAEIVAAFYRTHYPETVFDPYMLFMPFVGAFDEGRLIACAGTLVQSARRGVALIGHFATAPSARGRGLATLLGGALLWVLAEAGFKTIYLATTTENRTAIGVYERLGFSVADRRMQLDLMP